jgi:hypothetical protein
MGIDQPGQAQFGHCQLLPIPVSDRDLIVNGCRRTDKTAAWMRFT